MEIGKLEKLDTVGRLVRLIVLTLRSVEQRDAKRKKCLRKQMRIDNIGPCR